MNKIIKKKNPLVIFDFDGTICDSINRGLGVLNDYLSKEGYKQIQEEQKELFRSLSIVESLSKLGVPIWRLPFLVNYIRKNSDYYHEIEANAGMIQLLKDLDNQKICMVILTSNSLKNVNTFIQNNNLNFFDCIYTGGSVFGKSNVLKKIIKNKRLDPSVDTIVYIGDEVRDIKASRKVNIISIGVTWGMHSKNLLFKHNPTYLCDSSNELQKILQNLIN